MGRNNDMYHFFNEMLKGYKEQQDGLFEHAVRCWMDMEPENPFKEDDPAYEQFFLMQKGYTVWRRGAADRKINRRRMLEAAYNLCALNPKKPYRFDKEEDAADKKAEAEAKAEAERKAMEEAKRLEELAKESPVSQGENEAETVSSGKREHILGVVPKNPEQVKKSFLDRLFKR